MGGFLSQSLKLFENRVKGDILWLELVGPQGGFYNLLAIEEISMLGISVK